MHFVGPGFPTIGCEIGDTYTNTGNGGLYEYLGDDPTDTVQNWLLVGGKLSSDPDISAWGVRQSGARWFNTTDGQFKGWNGYAIVYLG